MDANWHAGQPGGSGAGALDARAGEAVFQWLVRLRWVALCGVTLVLLLSGPVTGRLPGGAAAQPWVVAALLLVFNASLAILGPRRSGWLGKLAVQLVVDCLALGALVHFAGGIENPFLLLFVLQVVTANIVLRRPAATFILCLAVGLVAAIVIGEGTGVVPHHCLRLDGSACGAEELDLWALAVLSGLILTLVAASAFTRHLMDMLRRSQDELLETVGRLEEETRRLGQARELIEAEHSELQAIIDCMGDAVFLSAPDGRVLVSNPPGRELIAWDSAAGRDAPGPGDDTTRPLAEVLRQAAAAGLASHTDPAFELHGRTLEPTCSTVRTASGEALGVVTVVRDITERLAMKQHLMHEERLSVVGKLAATVAHEINNPIGVISLYSQHALAKLAKSSPVRTHLETIRRNADSCHRIIGDLLSLARPRKPERRRLDLRALCAEVVEAVTPLAERSGVLISSGDHGRDAPILVSGDVDQLRQAILNLVLNAVEAAREAGTVSVSAWEAQEGGDAIRVVEVHDAGPGISTEEIDRVFEPFFTTKETGTGLGLSVARTIVEGHAGRIDVESAQESGTTFRIVLPDSSLESPDSLGKDESLEDLTAPGAA